MVGSKVPPCDQSWALGRTVSAGDLRGEGQELFIQASRCEEIAKQVRTALDEDQIAWADVLDGIQDCSGAQFVGRVCFDDLYGLWQSEPPQVPGAGRRCDEQDRDFS
jgi:hypothetical protein